MDAGAPSSTLTTSCIECSHSQNETGRSFSQPGSDPVAQLCAPCSVLQRCRTNSVPTKGAEWAQIDALVETARSIITQLCQGHQKRAELDMKLNDLQCFIDNAQSLTAPIRMLPPEVLYEIFQWLCIEEDDYSLSVQRSDVVNTILTLTLTLDLSQVCAFWRTLVLSQPTLWASLSLDLERVSDNEMTQLVSYHLQRSRSRPLKLWISMYLDGPKMLSTQAIDLLGRLFATYERWHRIRIDASDDAMSSLLPRFATQLSQMSCFPILTNLEWRWDDDDPEDAIYSLGLLSLADFPELLCCSITAFSPAHLDSIRMPNLIQLELHFHFEDHPLAALLHLFPNLQECKISGLEKEDHPYSFLVNYPPHHTLRRLNFRLSQDLSSDSLGTFFHSLSLPRLESLKLYSDASYHSVVDLPSIGLLPMLDRSPDLTHLKLQFLKEQRVIQILDHLPSLTSLSLRSIHDFSPALFKRLMLTSDMPNLVPQLESQDIIEQRHDINAEGAWFLRLGESTIDSLCDMVESRCGFPSSVGVSRLESLSLIAGWHLLASLSSLPLNHRLRERLQPLVDAGLSLKLITRTSYIDSSLDLV